MEINFAGIIIALSTFLIIGLCHPLVIKQEYYTGTRYWWVWLIIGIACVSVALFLKNIIASSLLGVTGASFLWGIGELFSQKKRVEKGWFHMNPKRRHEYREIAPDETLCPVHHGKSIYAQKPEQTEKNTAEHED